MAKSAQLKFERVNGWGGKRRGAGRKNLSGTVNHMARPEMSAKWPLHVNLSLQNGLPSLRRKSFLKTFGPALARAKFFGLKINHFAILHNHIHLIVEGESNEAVARGMQSLTISLAKAVKRIARVERGETVEGTVFAGRYHAHVLKTPSEMRRALKYVLLNETRHDGRRAILSVFSSGFLFEKWNHFGMRFSVRDFRARREFWDQIVSLDQALSAPKSWLGSKGWMNAVARLRESPKSAD